MNHNPRANTASLIEGWRETPYFDAISKLAFWEHQVPEAALTKEFLDIILFLQKQSQELLIKQFINKSRQEGLSEVEKINLQELLRSRHQQVSSGK